VGRRQKAYIIKNFGGVVIYNKKQNPPIPHPSHYTTDLTMCQLYSVVFYSDYTENTFYCQGIDVGRYLLCNTYCVIYSYIFIMSIILYNTYYALSSLVVAIWLQCPP
jgi:hypothetical protein